ncbi:MAG: hypothetical protein IPJ61_09200 [Tessaracoccus sp.]|uniref:hypothetical protein n=1 Tax=Tessaracoccus sp. TaxID=1971211 RepID=UPI001ED59A6A|nr:hypothetical protein [Tessaracoccus sp.]MBK7821238.1 hypothetical protein [Tessaracoccus sp.]
MNTLLGTVAAVRVGRVRIFDWGGRPVPSGCAKEPVDGAVRIGELGLPVDSCAPGCSWTTPAANSSAGCAPDRADGPGRRVRAGAAQWSPCLS